MAIRFVIGLGNPDAKYSATRHNLGQVLVSRLAKKNNNLVFEGGSLYRIAQENPEKTGFVKFYTYMNASGEAAQSLLKDKGCSPEEILICYDDFDLPLGTIRIRKKGSPGTHNGLRSVTECLGTENFPRLRLGIGPVPPGIPPDKFVLQKISDTQLKLFDEMLDRSTKAVDSIINEGLDKAMNQFNSNGENK